MSDEWPLSEEIRNVECYTDEHGVQCPLVVDEERVDWANRAAVLEAETARLRAALEWLAGISEGCAQASPCPAAVLSYDKREAACRECLLQAALKAAEEASDDT